MSKKEITREEAPEQKRVSRKALDDEVVDQVAGGSGEPDGYEGSTGYETAGFLLP